MTWLGGTIWTKELLELEAKKYETRAEFQRSNMSAYQKARRTGVLNEICAHMLWEGGKTTWEKQEIHDEALKYTTRSEFAKKSANLYGKACEQGILDDVCSHMVVKRIKWTFEKIKAVAANYTTRSEFNYKEKGAYLYAYRKGWLDEICKHMIDGYPTDNDAVYIWRVIDLMYNGKLVFKVGITSTRLDDIRIRRCASKNKMNYEIVILKSVQKGMALKIERLLKTIGENPKLSKSDGFSEFRAMTDTELNHATTLINTMAI